MRFRVSMKESSMAEVFLGMPGKWADDNREVSDHYTTKVGGIPDWPVPGIASSPLLCECSVCRSRLRLVAQVFAPVSSGGSRVKERVIYIFGCVTPKCGRNPASWRVLRVQKSSFSNGLEPTFQSINHQTHSSLTSTLSWGDNLLESSLEDEEDDIDLEELSKSFAEATKSASKLKKKVRKHHAASTANRAVLDKSILLDDVMPCFYIYALEEPSSKGVNSLSLNSSSLSIKDSKRDSDDSGEEAVWDQEKYEYDRALNADRTYLKFKKQIDLNPEQCFRYSYGGNPLLTRGEYEYPGKCKMCGSDRQYEMQLMPPLLYFLEEQADDFQRCQLQNWDWMTILVYTCSKSCGGLASSHDGWSVVEEALVLQFE